MRAAVFNGPHLIEVANRPDPVVRAPTDAVVRVALGCVCGSDLWYYRGESRTTWAQLGTIPGAYAAMDERRAIKALIRIETGETRR